jgi:hypothetical protein
MARHEMNRFSIVNYVESNKIGSRKKLMQLKIKVILQIGEEEKPCH